MEQKKISYLEATVCARPRNSALRLDSALRLLRPSRLRPPCPLFPLRPPTRSRDSTLRLLCFDSAIRLLRLDSALRLICLDSALRLLRRVFVDSTMGCPIPIPIPNSISVSLPLPLIQVLSQRFFNLILGDELISLVWYLELSFDLSLFLALVRPFTAVCSPFTAVCSSIFVVFKSLCAQFQLNGLMPHISTHHVNRIVYCPVSAFMEFVLLPILSSTLCGFGVGNVLLKIRDTSNTEVIINGFVAMLKIVDCALVAALILGFISLIVVTNFQGFILLYSSIVAEIRGLLDIISCLSVLYAHIFLCCICFLVIAGCCLPWMASSSCTHTFSIYGE
ncbi:hypothetical protein DY000_02005768 [Brassica cretica]|uniref:Uncharacterized protein n=1 Tax=Brassica cretica TaxID=69181 RepID=A0ABQ7BWV1_BRACR|nr:hypothetical protein DY000_02005768 [Brassica cretica]